MTTTTTPPKPPPRFGPPRTAAPTAPTPLQRETKSVSFAKPSKKTGCKIVLYGPGGIGKTTLAANLPGRTVFIDLEGSLGRLGLENEVVSGVDTWADLRAALQGGGWDGVDSVVIDSVTRAEELAVAHTLENVKADGMVATSIESYGYGKGYTHVFETFMPLLGDIERHSRVGRNVVLICHDCTANVPNPAGEDWLRYEPRLMAPSSGKNSIRLRVREWADHVLFLNYDIDVNKDGKGRGNGSRTIYAAEFPFCMAKGRNIPEQIVVGGEADEIWGQIL